MSSPFLPYAKQSIQSDDIQAVTDALKEDAITRGPPVRTFEESIASYCGSRYAVAFANGTVALMAAYFALDLQAFDRVISTPNTFIATVGIPIREGIQPQFVDIDRTTGNLDLNQLKKSFNMPLSRGRFFIVPVHFSGIAVDMQMLDRSLCHPDCVVIEDAAHAIGSLYPSGERVGSCAYSDMTIFSFHPAKTMTTGEGGMVTTNDANLYHRLRLYRDNGIEREAPYLKQASAPGYYEVQAITGNFNVTSFQAALGLSQLKRLDSFIEKRRTLVAHYRKNLKNFPHLSLFSDRADSHTAFHLLVAQIDFKAFGTTREKVMEDLKNKGIGSQVHYIPLYRHPVVKSVAEEWLQRYPQMEAYYAQALSLPLYADLTLQEVDRVCETLRGVLKA